MTASTSLPSSGAGEPVLPSNGSAPAGNSRFQTFTDAASRLRRGRGLLHPSRWLLLAGPILLAFGVALIVLGWAGAAYTTDYFAQVPYLISGGVLGLALVVSGGLCYVVHFLLLADSRSLEATAQVVDALDKVGHSLARIETLLSVSGVPHQASVAPRELVMTAAGKQIHRSDCPVVTSRSATELRSVRAIEATASLCRICRPAVATSGAE